MADILKTNIWFSSKVTNSIEKKFQLVIHHHESIVKSAQHHRLGSICNIDVMQKISSIYKDKTRQNFIKTESFKMGKPSFNTMNFH